MKEPLWDCWCVCTTNTCVTFIVCVERVSAPSAPEAGASVMKHLLEYGTSVQLMHNTPKFPVAIVSICPFRIAESPVKVLQ
jgi:hypothetical protein